MAAGGPADPLAAIRESCRWVAQHARAVQINDAAVAEFASTFQPSAAGGQQRPHEITDVRRRVNWVCTVAQLAFGSGYRRLLQTHCRRGASDTMMRGTLAMVAAGCPFDAVSLASVDLQLVGEKFGLSAPELLPLAKKVVSSLTETATILQNLGYQDWYTFLEGTLSKTPSCSVLVAALVAHFPTFQDSALYEGRQVHLYKKAQAMVVLLHRLCGSDPELPHLRFVDLHQVTILADNVVPAMMAADGVLVLSPALKARVDKGELLPHGCPEEVELRACAVEAGERIVARAAAAALRCMDVDYALWLRGKEGRFRAMERHATQDTEFY
eukprot:EG_transcript_14284